MGATTSVRLPGTALAIVALTAAAGSLFGLRSELQEARALSDRFVLAELRRKARDASPKTRRSAVVGLQQLGTSEAWSLIVDALADPESLVADRAQLALADLDDPKLLRKLLGSRGLGSRKPGVARRVAEALGRLSTEVRATDLAGELSAGSDTCAALLGSVESLAHRGLLAGDRDPLLERVRKIQRGRRRPELAGRALLTLQALEDPEAESLAAAALGHRHGALRCAALLAARRAGWAVLGSWSRRLAGDPERRVRLQALENLEQAGTRADLVALIDRLEAEPGLALRWRVVEALRRLTGMKYRTDPRPWRLFASRLPDDWTAADAVGAPARGTPPGEESKVFGASQLVVQSDRVCFLFDFSGSMWTELEDGRTPKQIVDLRLREALEMLAADTEFNLIPYTGEPLPWKSELVVARRSHVDDALAFFERCTARGRGNFHGAALLALEDPRVDRVLVLTDGVPTGGFHSHMDLIAADLVERNLLRKVRFDALLVDAPGAAARRWRAFCARSGGDAIEVEL